MDSVVAKQNEQCSHVGLELLRLRRWLTFGDVLHDGENQLLSLSVLMATHTVQLGKLVLMQATRETMRCR